MTKGVESGTLAIISVSGIVLAVIAFPMVSLSVHEDRDVVIGKCVALGLLLLISMWAVRNGRGGGRVLPSVLLVVVVLEIVGLVVQHARM